MKIYNYIVSALAIILGGYIFYETSAYNAVNASAQGNSAIWPRILAVGFFVCAAVLILQTIFSDKRTEEDEVVIAWKGEGMKKVYLMLGLVVIFLIATKIVGMLLAFLILIPGIEWIMGCKNKLMYIVLPVGIVAFIYVFFYMLMSVRFPQPIWA